MTVAPYTFTNMPTIPLQHTWPAWVYDRQMEEYRAMYAFYNRPMTHTWAATDEKISDIQTESWKRNRNQQRHQRVLINALKKRKVTDTPRFLPFRGKCLKGAWQRFKVWRSKRQAWREQDWLNSRRTSHPIFS